MHLLNRDFVILEFWTEAHSIVIRCKDQGRNLQEWLTKGTEITSFSSVLLFIGHESNDHIIIKLFTTHLSTLLYIFHYLLIWIKLLRASNSIQFNSIPNVLERGWRRAGI